MFSAQACNSSMLQSAPSSDYKLLGDGTVIHNPTGLMWKRCSEGQDWNSGTGQCDNAATSYNW